MPDRAQRLTLTEADAAHVARAARRYARRNGLDAEDVAQASMLDAHRALDSFAGTTEGEWRSWLNRIVSNNACDAARRADRQCEAVDALKPDPVGTLTEADRVSLRIDLEIGLAREGVRVRELCELLKTVTLSEAARLMGISRSTANGWIASLRERLEAKGLRGYYRE